MLALLCPAQLAAAAPVSSNALMDAMRQTLQPPAPVVAPAPVAAPKADDVFIPAPAEEKKVERQAPEKIKEKSPFVPAPVATQKEEPKKEFTKKKEDLAPLPEVSADQSGVPLLTESEEAPTLLGQNKTAGAPQDNQRPVKKTAPVAVDNPPSFSKPRPLFSAPSAKKDLPGIQRVKTTLVPNLVPEPRIPAGEEITPIDLPKQDLKAGQKTDNDGLPTAPPAPDMAVIKPAGEASLPATQGQTLFSQQAGDEGVHSDPMKASVPSATEKKIKDKKAEDKEQKNVAMAAPEAFENNDRTAAAPVSSSYSAVVNKSAPVLHASCGAANGVGSTTMPQNNLCTQGSASTPTGKGPWRWVCKGENGGTNADCLAPLQVNGDCGMASGSQSASAPIGQLCASGKPSEVTGNGPWYWNCFGNNGGVVAQCVAYTLVSGVCGTAHNIPTGEAPQSGLCASGRATALLGEGPWHWDCIGSGEGTTVNCTAPLRRDGVCGTANNLGAAAKPKDSLCESGVASSVSGNGPWSWSCMGDNGGQLASCSAPMLQNAACGPAHGVGVSEKPADGLCVSGKTREVSGDGPWNWTCYGDNGGAAVNCTAPKRIDGQCGSAHQAGSAEKPQLGLCTSGAASDVIGSGPWQWSCGGAGGGLTVNCMAEPLVHAACGPAHGVSTTSSPTSGLCASGIPTSVLGAGPWLWSCQGAHGGSAANCMAPMQVNGACGSADATPIAGAPTANLCRSGTASSVSGNGPWSWTCQGGGGGISSTCQAPLVDMQTPAASATPTPVAEVPTSTIKAGNECSPTVKRWTITCQQGGYPANYTGVIVGETQTLCPTGVERGVWLSNSCAPATDSAPVSPSPGKLVTPPPPKLPPVTDVLPPVIGKLSSDDLAPPKKLFTPRYKGGAAPADNAAATPVQASSSSIAFSVGSEALDGEAVRALGDIADNLKGDDKSIVTLNAYAAMPADGNQQEARRIALARALAARSYLMRKGLASSRIDIRALGPAGDGGSDDRVDVKVK